MGSGVSSSDKNVIKEVKEGNLNNKNESENENGDQKVTYKIKITDTKKANSLTTQKIYFNLGYLKSRIKCVDINKNCNIAVVTFDSIESMFNYFDLFKNINILIEVTKKLLNNKKYVQLQDLKIEIAYNDDLSEEQVDDENSKKKKLDFSEKQVFTLLN